ncbi:UNVERIFIED_CONTAM: putative mitochondrial protein [Sesamum latifolium]|uniref:Mitochondrial protein n=1 Tax=Sesamum latifolium TaxID=2727402 RepID=A0AAW2XRK6_9LAMI
MHEDGRAELWYQGYTEKKEFQSWDELVVSVLERFEDLDSERVMTEFNKFHHGTTVNAYLERCRYRQVYMLLSDEEAKDYDKAEQEGQQTEDEEVEGDMEVSLHAMKGSVNCKTLKVNGVVGDKEVLILIDSGSTHYIIDEKDAGALGCELENTTPMIIRVADVTPYQIIEARGYDLVLGCDWLNNYNLIELDFHQFKKVEETKVLELLRQYDEVFQEPSILPPERNIGHCIELLPNVIPKKQHPYRYAYGQKTEIKRIVKEMLNNGIIRPSQSSFASPVLLVKKKDGGVVIDPQKIECMLKWPIPTTIKALRGFLELTDYYRRFIKGYGAISKPMIALLEKDAFEWNSDAELALLK